MIEMTLIVLENEYHKIEILTLGATIHRWFAFKERKNILISNENLLDYGIPDKGNFNVTVGRVANRIKHGLFTLNDKTYQLEKNFGGTNHGHGGFNGFSTKEFEVLEKTDQAVILKYASKDGEEGYPGTLTLLVTYILDKDMFKIIFDADTDKDTIVNITNHAQFNLSDEKNILNHTIEIKSKQVLEIDNDGVPNGKYLDTKSTVLDLNKEKPLKNMILDKEIQNNRGGIDHMFMFDNSNKVKLKYKNKVVEMTTTYPGVQLYSMNHQINQKLIDRVFEKHAGLAIEPQFEPNAINIPHFSNTVLKVDEHYHHEIIYKVYENL